MREILFRAWNKYHQKMYPVYMLNFESDLVYCKGDDYSGHTFGKIDCETMQFTGLTDKNGVKIFEGDLLASITVLCSQYDSGEYCYGLVDFFDGGFYQKYTHPDGAVYREKIEEIKSIVIGNIHQNPELLK